MDSSPSCPRSASRRSCLTSAHRTNWRSAAIAVPVSAPAATACAARNGVSAARRSNTAEAAASLASGSATRVPRTCPDPESCGQNLREDPRADASLAAHAAQVVAPARVASAARYGAFAARRPTTAESAANLGTERAPLRVRLRPPTTAADREAPGTTHVPDLPLANVARSGDGGEFKPLSVWKENGI